MPPQAAGAARPQPGSARGRMTPLGVMLLGNHESGQLAHYSPPACHPSVTQTIAILCRPTFSAPHRPLKYLFIPTDALEPLNHTNHQPPVSQPPRCSVVVVAGAARRGRGGTGSTTGTTRPASRALTAERPHPRHIAVVSRTRRVRIGRYAGEDKVRWASVRNSGNQPGRSGGDTCADSE